MRTTRFPSSILPLALVAALGILLGLGGFTLIYARGYSYLLDDPTACVNCHVMRDNYRSWNASSHRSATCNDCHVPHDLVGKYVVKAEHGFSHSWAFTFENPQVIQIKSRSLDIVEANCASCHEALIAPTFLASGHDGQGLRCTHCHSGIAHPPR